MKSILCLCICVVSLEIRLNDVYGFIDPQLTHEGNKFDDTQTCEQMLSTRKINLFYPLYCWISHLC